MIDPNDVSTVRVGQLPNNPFNLSDKIPHEIGTDLNQGTVQNLADVIGAYLDVSGGVGFRAVSVNDGDVLPTTTQEEFILVGPGTYHNVGGGADITTTEELNALVSNGTFWFIGVEIPITADATNVTQFVRDGFTNTVPSEDAVFEHTKNHIDDVTTSGTYVRTPGAWQTLDAAIADDTNPFYRAVCNVGLIDVVSDTFQIARADDTHLNVTGTSVGVIFPNFFDVLPAAPINSIKQIPTNTAYPLSSLTGALPAVGAQGVYFLGWRNSTQAFETATTSYVQNPNVFNCGVIFLKNVGGVISFIDTTRTVIPMPDVSQYSNLETTAIGVKANVFVRPNTGGLTVNNTAGEIVGLSVNYKGTNNDAKSIAVNSLTSFRRLNPGNANATVLPTPSTTVGVTDYWNGTTMVTLAAGGNATVQRWLLTVMGTIILQVGEASYNAFQDAKDSVYTASFTEIIPKGTYVEIGRMVTTKNTTDLGNLNQAAFFGVSSGSGAAGNTSTVSFSAISGFPGDNANLNASLNDRVRKSGSVAEIITGVKTFTDRSIINGIDGFIGSLGVLRLETPNTQIEIGGDTSYTYLQSFAGKPFHINKLGNNTVLNAGGGNVLIGTSTDNGVDVGQFNGSISATSYLSTINGGFTIGPKSGAYRLQRDSGYTAFYNSSNIPSLRISDATNNVTIASSFLDDNTIDRLQTEGSVGAIGVSNVGSDVLLRLVKPGGYGVTTFTQTYGNTYYSNGKDVTIKVEGLSLMTLAVDNSGSSGKVVFPNSNLLVKTTTDNGVDVGQFNGSIYSIAANRPTAIFERLSSYGEVLTLKRNGTGVNVGLGLPQSGILGFYSNDIEHSRFTDLGDLLINTTTNNGVDKLQVNGSIIATAIKKSGGTSSQILMADGSVKSDLKQITITTAVSITTDTLDAGGISMKGRHVIIDNGANNINITVNGVGTDPISFQKEGTGTITFVQGSGRTLRQVDGVAILNGAVGSTATVASFGTIDSLRISNA